MAYVIMTEKRNFIMVPSFKSFGFSVKAVLVSCTALLFRPPSKVMRNQSASRGRVRRVMQGQAPIVLCQEHEP